MTIPIHTKMLRKFKAISPKTIALALAVIALIVVGVVYAQHRSRINNPVIPSTNPLSEPKKPSASGDNSSSQQPSKNNNSSAQSTTQNGPPPVTPFGDFVSNHHPGGNTPTSEASTCNTSPGAVCYIQFTKGSEVKKLDSRTANANGAVIWYWDVKEAGLNAGTWTVTAVATLNGQTKTANDVQQLVVQ